MLLGLNHEGTKTQRINVSLRLRALAVYRKMLGLINSQVFAQYGAANIIDSME